MPTYNFINLETNEEFSEFMTIADMEKFLEENKHIKQQLSTPAIVDPTRLGLRKPDQGFRDVLKKAKSAHRGSTINTW